jgi:hypothetical protein
MEENNDIQQWFCLGCTSPQRELKVRDDVRRYGLEAFVPLKYEVKRLRRQEQRTLVPAISGLMFAKGTLDEVKEYISHAHYTVYIRKSTFSNKEDYLTIPTRAMEDFIAVTVDHEAHISYFRPEEIKLQAGDKIRVKGGIYDGKEGIIMRIKGKRNKHLVVQIPGLLVAAVEMTPELIELSASAGGRSAKSVSSVRGQVPGSPNNPASSARYLSPDRIGSAGDTSEDIAEEKPSKNIDGDKKYLYDTAHRLLFEITNKYKEDQEYYLLMNELKRCRARLITFKGFTPSTEAELALPMYMAAVLLDEDIPEAKERLEKAIARLKDSSKLKAKCLEMMSALESFAGAADAANSVRGQVPDSTSNAGSVRYLSPDRIDRPSPGRTDDKN